MSPNSKGEVFQHLHSQFQLHSQSNVPIPGWSCPYLATFRASVGSIDDDVEIDNNIGDFENNSDVKWKFETDDRPR